MAAASCNIEIPEAYVELLHNEHIPGVPEVLLVLAEGAVSRVTSCEYPRLASKEIGYFLMTP